MLLPGLLVACASSGAFQTANRAIRLHGGFWLQVRHGAFLCQLPAILPLESLISWSSHNRSCSRSQNLYSCGLGDAHVSSFPRSLVGHGGAGEPPRRLCCNCRVSTSLSPPGSSWAFNRPQVLGSEPSGQALLHVLASLNAARLGSSVGFAFVARASAWSTGLPLCDSLMVCPA